MQRSTFTKELLLLVLCACGLPAWPQSGNEGSIEGVLTDPSGAAVPGAVVNLRQAETGTKFTTTSDDAGLFRFPIVPVGTYELMAERQGFTRLIEKNLTVTVGARLNLALQLQVASQAESVEVSSGAPLVETTRSGASSTVGESAVSNLPAKGRNYLDFVLLTPGVVRGNRGFELSFGGLRKMNLLRLDGADNQNTFFGQSLGLSSTGTAPYQISLETVQEFQVNANSFSAEIGRAGAGVIDVVTKSGTNQFHGSAFWYYRDRSMNATDLVNLINGQPKSPYHFNQFGGTFGGPLRKDRLFFFASYEGQRSTGQNVVNLNLPVGFSLSTIPVVAGFQQRALAYLTARATPWLDTLNQNVYFLRLDAYLRPAHLLAVRWNRQRFDGSNQDKLGLQNALEHTGDSISHTDALNSSLTSTTSPSLVNVARFSYIRSVEAEATNSPNPEANVFERGQLVLTIGRSSMSPGGQKINHGQWTDTLSLLHGRHSFKLGGEVLLDHITFFNRLNFSGSYRFNSLESFGRSLAGTPSPLSGEFFRQAFSGSGTPGIEVHPIGWQFGGFLQDEWRVRRQLTLNLGVRYDLQTITKPTVRNPSAALAAAGLDTSTRPMDVKDVAPRLGLAWAPLANNRLVVRLAYGLFYAPTIPLFSSRPLFQNGVTAQTETFSAGTPAAALIPSYPNTSCGPPDPSGISPSCAAPPGNLSPPILMLFPRNFVQADVQQGTFGVEYQLANDLAVSLSYLAVKGTHLPRVRDINLATPETPAVIFIAGTTTFLNYQKFTLPRPIGGFDRIFLMESAGSSIYHGLALQVRRRFSHSFELSAAYTLSKVIDDNPESSAVNPGPSDSMMLSDATNARADRSPGVNDQRHRFVLSGVWELRYADRLPRAAHAILGGWQLSGIFTAQSGLPYSGMLNFDLNNDGNTANDRTPGLGRNTFQLPRSISLDPRVMREFHLSERAKLAFAWEAFNVLNHGNLITVQTIQFGRSTSTSVCGIAPTPCLVPQNTGLSAFGVPTTTSGPRIMQLAAKLVF